MAAQIVSLVVLSRMLSAEDFGIFAIAIVYYEISQSMADLGLRQLMLKSAQLERNRLGEAFGLSILSSTAVSGLCAILLTVLPSNIVPGELELVFWVLALLVFLGPLDLIYTVPPMQEMRFGLVSIADVIAAWSGCFVSILFAWLGFGPVALVLGLFARRGVFVFVLAHGQKWPSPPTPRMTGWRTLLGDGTRLSLWQMFRLASELSMVTALSATLGMAAVGILNRATRVVKLFDTVVLVSLKPVVLPGFAQAIKRGEDPANLYLKKVELLSALAWPIYATIAVLADPLCALLLGAQWTEAPLIVRLLALVGIGIPFTKMTQSFFVATDEIRLGMMLSARHYVVRPVLGGLGAIFSLEAACLGLAAAQCLHAARQSKAIAKKTGYDHASMRRILMQSAVLTVCTSGSAGLVLVFLQGRADVLVLVMAGLAAAAGFAGAVIATRHSLLDEAKRAIRSLSNTRFFQRV